MAQNNVTSSTIEVEHGVMREKKSGREVAFFGVNYCAPFAHGYRMIEKMGKDHKKEIEKDVYHFSRLDFDAFRIHIWDTEISDSLGNVLDNKHLDLLDYMFAQLEKRHIKIIITAMNFYDNAYPDGATPTPGFANYISKGKAPRNKAYWPVIKRYLTQLINHVNPYTKKSYKNDPNIIGLEIINEPSHGGDLKPITNFINVMADHILSGGWKKPIFYNISQNPGAAKAVENANIDGVSFQWYPAGLVGGKEIQGNYLPYVDTYNIPFKDDEKFKSKAQMVYEFSSADLLKSYVYPAIARSFREAGFQWATQFAYDPLAIAYDNSDYQTHYLNLAYTPSKAMSMKIASAAFHQLPRSKDFGSYPADTLFGNFRVSYSKDLSEMNTDTAFYYTNTTQTAPRNPDKLKHIAGVGSSPLVSYQGTGAYFLDKLDNGVWRLELMPDAIHIRDPFKKPNPDKWVTTIEWHKRPLTVHLSGLGASFQIRGLNKGNSVQTEARNGKVTIGPGAYLLTRSGVSSSTWNAQSQMGTIHMDEFVAPPASNQPPVVRHTPYETVEAGKAVTISAMVAGLQPADSVSLIVQSGFRPQHITMKQVRPYLYKAVIPAKAVYTGALHYWIVIDEADQAVTFPGNHPGKPSDWDYYYEDQYESAVMNEGAPLEIFNAKKDRQDLNMAFSFWNRGYHQKLVSTEDPGQFALQVSAGKDRKRKAILGWGLFVGNKLSGRKEDAGSAKDLVVKAKADSAANVRLKVILIDRDGNAFSSQISLSQEMKAHQISLNSFQPDSSLLLPRPFPGFQPLWFKPAKSSGLNPAQIEKIQFIVEQANGADSYSGYGMEVESAWLK